MTSAVKETRDEAATPQERPPRRYLPVVDIVERAGDIVLVADMPGVEEGSVGITLEGDTLTIRGSAASDNEDAGGRHAYQEYSTGDFERTFTLGDSVGREGIEASMRNGVLRVVLPKAREAVARKIPVKTA